MDNDDRKDSEVSRVTQVSGSQRIEERKKMLEALKNEKELMADVLERYYDHPQDPQHCYELLSEVVEMVDRLELIGDWDSSLFLRGIIDPFREIRDQCQKSCEVTQIYQQVEERDLLACEEGNALYFIILYQTDGNDLSKWFRRIKELPEYVSSRPAYATEEEAGQVVRAKTKRESMAYVIARLNEQKVSQSSLGSSARKDESGREMVLVTDDCMKFEDIVVFVHLGKRYQVMRKGLSLLVDENLDIKD